jgi:hypothetical protein
MAENELSLLGQTVRRWRELGGIVALEAAGNQGVVTESEDEATLRAAPWLYYLQTDEAKEALDALPDVAFTTVLKASGYGGVTIAAPPQDSWNISSWGDWEMKVEHIPKQAGCTTMVDLALRALKLRDWDEYSTVEVDGEERKFLAAMEEPRCALWIVEEVSWDTVMNAMGDAVSVEMFGATNTVPQKIVQATSDGNEKIYFVDVGDSFYVCEVQTS